MMSTKYTALVVVGAVLLSLALVKADEAVGYPEEKVGQVLSDATGRLGNLGRKLVNGARNAISRIPVIGKFASGDEKPAPAGPTPVDSSAGDVTTTTPAPDNVEQVENSEETATPAAEEEPKEATPEETTTPAAEEASKEVTPEETTTPAAEEAPKEEAPKDEAPKEQ